MKTIFNPKKNYVKQEIVKDDYYVAYRHSQVQNGRDYKLMIQRVAGCMESQGVTVVFDDELIDDKRVKEVLKDVKHNENIERRKIETITNICNAPEIIEGEYIQYCMNKELTDVGILRSIEKHKIQDTYNIDILPLIDTCIDNAEEFLSLIDKNHKINELNKKILKYDPLN